MINFEFFSSKYYPVQWSYEQGKGKNQCKPTVSFTTPLSSWPVKDFQGEQII